jgi:hypothetical protein
VAPPPPVVHIWSLTVAGPGHSLLDGLVASREWRGPVEKNAHFLL